MREHGQEPRNRGPQLSGARQEVARRGTAGAEADELGQRVE
jgi:hypothetical protein